MPVSAFRTSESPVSNERATFQIPEAAARASYALHLILWEALQAVRIT